MTEKPNLPYPDHQVHSSRQRWAIRAHVRSHSYQASLIHKFSTYGASTTSAMNIVSGVLTYTCTQGWLVILRSSEYHWVNWGIVRPSSLACRLLRPDLASKISCSASFSGKVSLQTLHFLKSSHDCTLIFLQKYTESQGQNWYSSPSNRDDIVPLCITTVTMTSW